MKLFYEKYIYFFTNLRKDKKKISYGKHKSQELRNHMKKKVKALAINKVRANSSGRVYRFKLGPIVVSHPEGNWHKTYSREDVDLFIYELLIKRRTSKKNLIEIKCKKQYLH